MIKVMTVVKRKQGLTYEEFSDYWEKKHGPLVVKVLPGLERYVQSHAIRLPGGGEPKIDGVAEIWYNDVASWRAGAAFYLSDGGKVIRNDEEKFMDRSKTILLVAEEKVIKQ